MKLFGFIGVGNMGFAMVKSVAKEFPGEVSFWDISDERTAMVEKSIQVKSEENTKELVKNSKIIILGVKPQYYESVLLSIKDDLHDNNIIISIAPGIMIEDIKKIVGDQVKVLRSMPNTAAMIGESMTGITYNIDEFSQEEKDHIDRFFSSFGKWEFVEEDLMNAVVCANGSSPAYAYIFMEALADSVVKYGIPRDKAYRLVSQTLLGASKMLQETNLHPGELKDMVCSPGGTTIAGVAALEEHGFRNAIIKATDACYNKTKK